MRGLIIPTGGQLRPVVLAERLAEHIGARKLARLPLTASMGLWYDALADIGDRPVMNVPAMFATVCLAGPVGARVIFGDVLVTGNGAGGYAGLSMADLITIRSALEAGNDSAPSRCVA